MQYENIAQLIGRTPLLELCGYEKKEGLTAHAGAVKVRFPDKWKE